MISFRSVKRRAVVGMTLRFADYVSGRRGAQTLWLIDTCENGTPDSNPRGECYNG